MLPHDHRLGGPRGLDVLVLHAAASSATRGSSGRIVAGEPPSRPSGPVLRPGVARAGAGHSGRPDGPAKLVLDVLDVASGADDSHRLGEREGTRSSTLGPVIGDSFREGTRSSTLGPV